VDVQCRWMCGGAICEQIKTIINRKSGYVRWAWLTMASADKIARGVRVSALVSGMIERHPAGRDAEEALWREGGVFGCICKLQ